MWSLERRGRWSTTEFIQLRAWRIFSNMTKRWSKMTEWRSRLSGISPHHQYLRTPMMSLLSRLSPTPLFRSRPTINIKCWDNWWIFKTIYLIFRFSQLAISHLARWWPTQTPNITSTLPATFTGLCLQTTFYRVIASRNCTLEIKFSPFWRNII